MEFQKRERDEFTSPISNKRQNLEQEVEFDLSFLDLVVPNYSDNLGFGLYVDLCTVNFNDFTQEDFLQKQKKTDPVPPSFQQMSNLQGLTNQPTFVFPWIIAFGGVQHFN